MVSIPSLWLPIVLGAVLVFGASSVVHMFLAYHRTDFKQLAEEDKAMAALRVLSIPPGDYMMPFSASPDVMRSEAYQAKVQQGPIASLTVMPPSVMTSMGTQFGQWFAYCLVVGVFAAYVAGRSLPAGASYLEVFRLTGTVAFASYALALPQASIWFKKDWSATGKSMFDGLVYAALTAGVFGWLWPA